MSCSDQGVITVDNYDNSLLGLTAAASEELFNSFLLCFAVTFLELVLGRIAVFYKCLLIHDSQTKSL